MTTQTKTQLIGAIAVLLASSAPLGAQSGATSPWLAWYGCWTSTSTEVSPASRPVTCVLPSTDGNPLAAEHVVVAGERIAQRRVIVADGVQRAISDENCEGWESARFSDDRARVYLRGEARCGDIPAQKTSGVMALTAWSEWLQVDAVITGEEEALGVNRAQLLPWSVLPESMLEELAPLERAAQAARAAASLDLKAAHIADVSGAVDDVVAMAWVVETAQSGKTAFQLPRRDLVMLDQAGLPDRVIDAAVAAAHPQRFVATVSRTLPVTRSSVAENGPAGIRGGGGGAANCGAAGWGPWGYDGSNMLPSYGMAALYFPDCVPLNFFSYYGLFGRYGTVGHYPGFFPGNGGYPVTVVVTPVGSGDGEARPRGSVVNGQGYRAPRTRSAGTASSAAPPSNSGDARSSGSSNGSSNSGRTAKRRTP